MVDVINEEGYITFKGVKIYKYLFGSVQGNKDDRFFLGLQKTFHFVAKTPGCLLEKKDVLLGVNKYYPKKVFKHRK